MNNGFRYVQAGLDEFKNSIDRRPFEFQHYLANHSLFEIPRLVELVLSRPGAFYYDQGENRADQKWNTLAREHSIAEAIERIEQAKAWIVINHAEKDPAYRQLLDEALDEILSGSDVKDMIKSREVIIFVSSPKRVTSYHIDRECNFLLQLTGEKTLYVFDRDDRDVLPEDEIERFWSVANDAATYRPQYQERAKAFHLVPGSGVHIPVNYPHWVQNGDAVSVSVSINFQFHDRVRASVYRMNYLMRKIGLNPTPPGRAPWKDSVKALGMTPLVAGGKLARRISKT